MKYDHKSTEKKWLTEWEKQKLFYGKSGSAGGKMYRLFAFPYPSGVGLHVGHVESKTALDILARFDRMTGKQPFFPVGWDAFGLPAENYAVETGVPPDQTTKKAIISFKKQIKRLGISYAWDTEISTSHPGYYKWTQWLFIQLFKKGLAYKAPGKVNWCPSCKTVLANEQVVNGACERCHTEVIQKEMDQWYFKITKYAEELISGLEQVDWPKATADQQLNWIGKKRGIDINYSVAGTKHEITCWTSRPDTNYGATFIVLAPEHPMAVKIVSKKHLSKVTKYIEKTKKKSLRQRLEEVNTKTGVFTGAYAINQLTGKKMPIWISDFVLMEFGTGAVVGVPGHDMRDYEFAKKFDLEVIRVVVGRDDDKSEITKPDQVQEKEGKMVNSDFLDGLDIHKATVKMMDYMEEKGWGKRKTTYRLRDWLISRQRYWGAPIPIVYDPKGKPHLVKQEHLPWMLPTDVDFNPKGTSPLGSSKELFERTEKLYGKGWKPEIDTMDTFVDSSWYYLRYADPRNESKFADKKKLKELLPVDFYMIGPEHIVLHLLYSRFITKFLRDEGYLEFDEPFIKMRHQGIILGPDHMRMSKSRGNIINPDEYVDSDGADALRMYEMFMGPIDADKVWGVRGITGLTRFLARVYRLSGNTSKNTDTELESSLHLTIKKVGEDISELKFNTAISAMMTFVNLWEKTVESGSSLTKRDLGMFVRILAPFAPFITEELWVEVLGERFSVHTSAWPKHDPKLIKQDEAEIVVQVNGKLRSTINVPVAISKKKDKMVELAKEDQRVSKWLKGKKIKKEIFIPGKLVNFVVN